ncbi:endo alpha-1,4 polygalactosaminidase, partial [Actinocorallia lasiicapitis]
TTPSAAATQTPAGVPTVVPKGGPTSAQPRPAHGRWRPKPGEPWQWQLSVPVDRSVDVPVYDIDGFENSAEVVAALHGQGRKVICYISVGSTEDFRPDHGRFPPELLGKPNGWPGERWLDIRRRDLLKPIMADRIKMCADKGFDAVEPDLVESYAEDTGFPISASDQLKYNRMIANLAHMHGLSVGLKNDLGQIKELVRYFDFAVNEECAEYGECEALAPFVTAGKAVLHVEYALTPDRFCGQRGFSSMRKRLELGPWRQPCPGVAG